MMSPVFRTRPRGLYRSWRNNIFLGVCAGIAERFDFSAWGIRLLFVALQFTLAPFLILIYVALGLLLKRAPRWRYTEHSY